MVDTVNGKVRVRAWPKPRGKNVPEQVRIQNDRFTAAQKLAKLSDPAFQNRLKDATKGTGLYPRDVLTKLMLAPQFEIEETDGRKITHGRREVYSIMFQGFSLRLSADQATPGATLYHPTWPLPVVDTAGFFDPGQPDRITIPDHVNGMIFFAGGVMTATSGVSFLVLLENLTNPPQYIAQATGSGPDAACISTGPVPVTPGEQYAYTGYRSAAGSLLKERTFFSGIVVSTDF